MGRDAVEVLEEHVARRVVAIARARGTGTGNGDPRPGPGRPGTLRAHWAVLLIRDTLRFCVWKVWLDIVVIAGGPPAPLTNLKR